MAGVLRICLGLIAAASLLGLAPQRAQSGDTVAVASDSSSPSDESAPAEDGVAAFEIVRPTTPASPVELRLVDPSPSQRGWWRSLDLSDEEWRAVLAVYVVGESEGANLPPMLGTYTRLENGVRFDPRFPFRGGLEYRILANLGPIQRESGDEQPRIRAGVLRFALPTEAREPTTTVEAVFPTSDLLPANLLRFYIYFSAPMRGGEVLRHVHLIDDAGEVVPEAFVETVPELWDAEMRRLTVIVHPGRIKQGLDMGDRMGPSLQVGRSYRLRVDADLRDAAGQPMVESFEKLFRVGPDDRRSPDPAAWQITSPAAGSLEPVIIEFASPLDHALARRLVAVQDFDGSPVEGTVELGEAERSWSFVPTEPWRARDYELLVHPSLEDLAGNRIDRLFDERASTQKGDDGGSAKRPTEAVVLTYRPNR